MTFAVDWALNNNYLSICDGDEAADVSSSLSVLLHKSRKETELGKENERNEGRKGAREKETQREEGRSAGMITREKK